MKYIHICVSQFTDTMLFTKSAVVINFKDKGHFVSEIIRFDLSSSTLENVYSYGCTNINAGQQNE